MPELPEVETIARTLAPYVTGQQIVGGELITASTLEGPMPLQAAYGYTVNRVGRRGKLLLLHFDTVMAENDENSAKAEPILGLAFHLRMTGRLFVYPQGTEPHRHTRLILNLCNGKRLFFDDVRKFARMRVMTEKALSAWPFWQSLGPEPLTLGKDAFVEHFLRAKGNIKATLLNQSRLAGIGNIYADESLFRAQILPSAQVQALTEKQLSMLYTALCTVLNEAIAECGSSIRDYRTANGDAGAFQNKFNVYGRAGQACTVCARTLQKSKVAGRTTVFCPSCQHC